MPLGKEVGHGPACHTVLDWDQLPHEKGHCSPHFHGLRTKPASVNHGHVDCDETAALIKIPLGTEVGVGPGDIVLDGDPQLSAERGIAAPHFSARVLWPNGWRDHDMPLRNWYGGSLGPGDIMLDGGPSSLIT